MTLEDAVRREARRRRAGSTRRPAARASAGGAPYAADDWRDAEKALVAEVRRSPRAAKKLVDAFARLAQADGSREARGRAARLRGSWASFTGRDREALADYRTAERALAGLAADGARLGRAASLLRLGRFADARRVCASIRRSAAARGDVLTGAMADVNEGVALLEGGRAASAEPVLRRARDAFREIARPYQAADAAQNLANALVLLDRFDEAESLYAEAADAYAAAGADAQAARCRMNRGGLLVATDRLGEADEELRACEAAFRSQGDTLHAALSRRDRGEALLRAGLLPEARHALASAQRGGRTAPPVERARTALLAARAALAAGDAPGARRALRSAPREVLDAAESAEVLGRAAAIERRADAETLLVRAAAKFGDARPVGRTRCLAAASWAAQERGDFDAATRHARAAERGASALPLPSLRFAAAAVRFLAESGAGRRAEADAALDAASDALESLRAGLGPEVMRAALLRGREAWLGRAVRHLADGPDGALRALAFLERWRARSLVDLLSDAGGGAPDVGAGTDGSDRLAALRRVAAALERRAAGDRAPGFLRGALAVSHALLRRLRAVEHEIVETAARVMVPAARAPDEREIARIARSLPADTLLAVLCDASAPRGTAARDDRRSLFIVRDGARFATIEPHGHPAEAITAVRDLHFALGAATLGPDYLRRHQVRIDRAVSAALARLADLVLAPLADRLEGAARVVVVPHGPWHHVPWAALPWRGRPLVESVAVSLVPALAALRDPPRPAKGRSVVVSAPDEFAPAVRGETERVAATLGATLYEGDAATSHALAALDRPACLHVAAHGRHRPDAPGSSGVRLADGWFRAAEFGRLRLAGSVVVLSGCETGMTEIDAGDEPHGLVRGVLAAGATDVVSSLWRIDDAATAAFMERLHALRAAGATVGGALAAVQREHAAAGAPPWHWAGFVHHTRRPAAR